MASYVTPKKNTAYRFFVSLASQSSTHAMQSNPTLAAGDVKVSKDGGALANLTTLPSVSPASSKLVQVDLSATEMDADNITVIFSDAAGAEWDDLVLLIQTTARQIDDLAYPATSGRSLAVDTSGQVTVGGYASGQAPLQPTTAGRTLDVSAGGEAGVDWANVGAPTTAVNLSGTTVKTATDVETDTQDLQSRLPAALVSGRMDSSIGAVAAGAIAAASFAAGALDAVWSTATRLLTAGTNIVLAKGTGVTGFNDLDAAGVRSAVGLAAANLDTQLAMTATIANQATINNNVVAVKAKTDNLPASPAAVGSAMTLTAGERVSIADALLTRDWTLVTGEAARSVLNALRFLRNKWGVIAGLLTVTKEDDATAAWTANLTSDATADPITGSDPT